MVNLTGLIEVWNKITLVDWIWIVAILSMPSVILISYVIKSWQLAHRKGPDHLPPPPPPGQSEPLDPDTASVIQACENVKSDACPEKKEPRTWEIPQDKIEEVLSLWDGYKDETNSLERYRFWKRIEELLPETKDIQIEFEPDEDVMHPYIRECLD
jgi:hypothetical protein